MLQLVILRLMESYFRHRWLYLLPIVMMTGLGAFFALTARPTYMTGGVLYVETQSYLASLTAIRETGAAWWTTPAKSTSEEIGELLKTDAFVRAIIQRTDLEKQMGEGPATVNAIIKETRKSAWTVPFGNNQLLINAVHEDPVIAYQIVIAVIEGYLQWRINADLAESEAARVFFSDLIETYEADLNAAREAMRGYLEMHPAPIRGERPGGETLEIDRLQAGINLSAARYANALDKEENTRLSMAQIESDARQTYFLIDAPHVPEEPNTSLRELALSMAIFVAVGVILSGGLIIGGALLDRTFRFPVDVIHWLDLPVLSMVPDITPPPRRFWMRKNTAVSAQTQPETTIGPATGDPADHQPASGHKEKKSELKSALHV